MVNELGFSDGSALIEGDRMGAVYPDTAHVVHPRRHTWMGVTRGCAFPPAWSSGAHELSVASWQKVAHGVTEQILIACIAPLHSATTLSTILNIMLLCATGNIDNFLHAILTLENFIIKCKIFLQYVFNGGIGKLLHPNIFQVCPIYYIRADYINFSEHQILQLHHNHPLTNK